MLDAREAGCEEGFAHLHQRPASIQVVFQRGLIPGQSEGYTGRLGASPGSRNAPTAFLRSTSTTGLIPRLLVISRNA